MGSRHVHRLPSYFGATRILASPDLSCYTKSMALRFTISFDPAKRTQCLTERGLRFEDAAEVLRGRC